MKCPSCSADLPDNAKFCLECGTKIAGQPAPSAPPAKKTPSLSRLSADRLAALLAEHPERAAECSAKDWLCRSSILSLRQSSQTAQTMSEE